MGVVVVKTGVPLVQVRITLGKKIKRTSGRVAEVAQGQGRPPPKSLDSDENFKPEHTLFCCELRIVAIYALFGNLWAKKCLLGQKQCFLGKKYTITWYILHISLS